MFNENTKIYTQKGISQFLQENVKDKNLLKPIHFQKFLKIINYIYHHQLKLDDKFGMVNIHRDKFIKLSTRRYYKAIMNELIRLGVVHCDNFYNYRTEEGEIKIKGYCLNQMFMSLDVEETDILNIYYNNKRKSGLEIYLRKLEVNDLDAFEYIDTTVLSLLSDASKIEIKEHNYWKNGKYVDKYTNTLTGDEQVTMYNKFIDQIKEEYGNDVIIDGNITLEQLLAVTNKASSYKYAIRKIKNKDFHYKVCNAGRVHTNFTNLASSLRRFTTIDNKRLVSIDLINSQPLILAILILQQEVLTSDMKDFITYCITDAKFYEKYCGLVGIAYNDENRKAIKQGFFKDVLFGKVPTTKMFENQKQFQKAFPNVWLFINKIKENNHADLATLLQKTESDMFIKEIAGALKKKRKTIITLHDSIYCTPENVDLVVETIIRKFQEKYGVDVKLKVDEEKLDTKNNNDMKEFNNDGGKIYVNDNGVNILYMGDTLHLKCYAGDGIEYEYYAVKDEFTQKELDNMDMFQLMDLDS